MGTVTYQPTDPEAQPFETERMRNEEQTRAHREGLDRTLPNAPHEPASQRTNREV